MTGTRQIFPVILLVELLRDDVQVVPDIPVVDLLKCIQLAIVSPTISINLRIRVLFQRPSHHPFAVDKAAIPEKQGRALTVWTWLVPSFADWAHRLLELSLNRQCAVPSVDDDQLTIDLTVLVDAVAEPIESIFDLSEPRRLLLKLHFLDVLDRVESKVYSQ